MLVDRVDFPNHIINFVSCMPFIGITPLIARMFVYEKIAQQILRNEASSSMDLGMKQLTLIKYGDTICHAAIHAVASLVTLVVLVALGLQPINIGLAICGILYLGFTAIAAYDIQRINQRLEDLSTA